MRVVAWEAGSHALSFAHRIFVPCITVLGRLEVPEQGDGRFKGHRRWARARSRGKRNLAGLAANGPLLRHQVFVGGEEGPRRSRASDSRNRGPIGQKSRSAGRKDIRERKSAQGHGLALAFALALALTGLVHGSCPALACLAGGGGEGGCPRHDGTKRRRRRVDVPWSGSEGGPGRVVVHEARECSVVPCSVV